MPNLTKAHEELFKRSGDETFPTLEALWRFCQSTRDSSSDHWRPPASLSPVGNGNLKLNLGSGSAPFAMNDWSFSQLCGFACLTDEGDAGGDVPRSAALRQFLGRLH